MSRSAKIIAAMAFVAEAAIVNVQAQKTLTPCPACRQKQHRGWRNRADVQGSWEVADTGDFDHDGKADILWRVKSTGAVYIDTDLRNGVIDTDHLVYEGGDPAWDVVNTGDYDGDGTMDVLMINDTSRTVLVYYLDELEVRESAVIPLTDDPQWNLVR